MANIDLTPNKSKKYNSKNSFLVFDPNEMNAIEQEYKKQFNEERERSKLGNQRDYDSRFDDQGNLNIGTGASDIRQPSSDYTGELLDWMQSKLFKGQDNLRADDKLSMFWKKPHGSDRLKGMGLDPSKELSTFDAYKEYFNKPNIEEELEQHPNSEELNLLKKMFDMMKQRDLMMAKGGTIMNNQMEMAFMKQGGLRDDGMETDPISGNEIPDGSMAKEVRDDIPAMLSEGEYVVPADVLRYYGMNFFENLRNQAKNSLTQMESSGRIGGEPISPEQAQRNMQIKPVGMPQPQAVNQGGFIQGFSNGGPPYQVSPFAQTPSQIRNVMSQTTKSYQDNIAKAEAEASTNTEEITVTKPHYGKNGEGPVQIAYVGSDINNLTIQKGQEELLKQYPLTKEQYDLLMADRKNNPDDNPSDPDQVSGGSSTTWMDGIDFNSDASVIEGATKILGGSLLSEMGTPLRLLDSFSSLAKTRGLVIQAKEAGKTELADKLEALIKDKIPSRIISLADNLGIAPGTSYGAMAKTRGFIKSTTGSVRGEGSKGETSDTITASKNISNIRDQSDRESGNAFESLEAARAAGAASRSSRSAADIVGSGTSTTAADTDMSNYKTTAKVNKNTGELDTSTTTDADYTAQPGRNVGGRNKGGLITKRTTKKKKSPRTTGLAGKR